MTYAHGFVNHSLYYPTTILAFVHVLLSVTIMIMVSDIKIGGGFLVGYNYEQEFDYVDDIDEISETHQAEPHAVSS